MRARSQDQRAWRRVEREQRFLGKRRQELNREERIAAGLLVHQSRERDTHARARSGANRQINAPTSSMGRGATARSPARRRPLADRIELAHQRMRRRRPRCRGRRRSAAGAAHPSGSAGARAGRASPRRAIADRRGTAPADAPARAKTPRKRRNTSWKAALRVLRREVGHRRLLADEQLQLGDEVDDELAVRTQRLPRGRRASAPSSASLLPRSGRIRPWKACARVA